MLKRLNAAALLICLPARLLQAKPVTQQNKPESTQQTGQQASQTPRTKTPALAGFGLEDGTPGQVASDPKFVVSNGQEGRYG